MIIKQKKYFQNLHVMNNYIYSYNTKVGFINTKTKEVVKLAWNVGGMTTSPTTSKHINYIASLIDYKVK